jgi:RND superfamily putative drug exporter
MLRRISRFSAGRRSKWAIIAAWLVLGVALGQLQPKLQDATTNENEAFLPESAESTEVNDLVEQRFAEGREVDILVAYERAGGLGARDRERIAADARRLCGAGLAGVLLVVDPFGGPVCGDPATAGLASPGKRGRKGGAAGGPGGPGPTATASGGAEGRSEEGGGLSPVSDDGSVALLLVRTNSEESEEIQANVEEIRDVVPGADSRRGELRSYVTGIGGIISDSIETFESIDVTLLTVTITLVLVLLLAIYRSPVVALVPLIVVGVAYSIAAAAVYGLVEAGVVEVNGQSTSLLIVLMFGAGTDYCLLIVARFREELRRTGDKHEAMARATERTGPAILSAGATVVAAMLVLSLADFKATQTMGPVLALGVAIMLLAGLTFLPATLAALGRNAFWPAIPRVGSEPRRPVDVWRRIGHLVHDRPVMALTLSVLFLGLGALGGLQDRGTLDFGEGFRNDPDSVQGQELIERELSAGQTAVSTVVASRETARPVARALRASEGVDGVAFVGLSEDGELARIDVTLAYDPFSDEASAAIPVLRDRIGRAAGGERVLLGGTSAENYDTTETLRSDAKVIVPLILVLIFLILCVLLRAVVAPLYLVATVVLSYGFALGASNLIFTELFNQPDGDPGLPTFAFIFLVALGVDYNIFLISRIREEAEHQETKEAVISGLEKTGGVITSAGLILAGTFCALMTLPLEALFQIGFTVAFGLLIDTFLVRTVVVPSIAFLLGPRNWWPGRLAAASEGGRDPAPPSG